MAKIIAIANQKGGVGKTTTTMSIGAALAKRGKKVLLIDLDPQGNLTEYLGYEGGTSTINELLMDTAGGIEVDATPCICHNESENIDYIPATLTLSNADMMLFTAMNRETVLRRVLQHDIFKGYDYIIIDCLPSLGILTINAFAAATSVIIPVQAQKFAVDEITSLLNILHMVQRQLNPTLRLEGILLTMTDRTNMSKAVSEAVITEYSDLVFETCISRSTEAANSTYSQRSLVSYSNKLGKEYDLLASEILYKEEQHGHQDQRKAQ